jgi:hypothetical protein
VDAYTTTGASDLDRLCSIRVIIGRPTSTSSVLVDHEGRRCLVAFTAMEPMAAWWKQRSHRSLRTSAVMVPELVERWGAPDVDLLLDPGTPQQRHIPIATLRSHLGLGPVIPDGDGTEPVRFLGFSSSLYAGAKSLVLVPFSVMIVVLGVAGGNVLALVGLVMLAVSLLLARSTFRELRAAVATRHDRRATRAARAARASSS